MKTILVPTDYSPVADNATRYAVELAKQLNAKLIFFHAYHRPVLLSSLAMVFADLELEKKALEELQAEEYNTKHDCCDGVETESLVYKGNTIDGIRKAIKEHDIDYIVMGLTGTTVFTEVLIGSTAISVIEKTKIPVFIIPQEARFKNLKKFAFIYNYNEPIPQKVSEELSFLCNAFGSELLVFGKPELEGEARFPIERELKKSGVSVLFHTREFTESEYTTNEINDFIESNSTDLLIMMPDNSSSVTKLFSRNITTQMAFHTHLPLLILRGEEQKWWQSF